MLTYDNEFGYCSQCGYEYNSELLNEYDIKHCPGCGAPLYQEGSSYAGLKEDYDMLTKRLRVEAGR